MDGRSQALQGLHGRSRLKKSKEIGFVGPIKTGHWVRDGKKYNTYDEAKMGRPKTAIDETVLFAACKDGATVTRLLGIFGGTIDRETMRKRVKDYVAAGKLIWTRESKRGRAGILKTV